MERRQFLIGSTAALGLLGFLGGCSSPPSTPAEDAAKRREIDTSVDATLTRLHEQIPSSRALTDRAVGVLVFPSVVSAGAGIGGAYGEGALRSGASTVGYYQTTSGSLGATLGAQTQSVIFLFMTDGAYQKFLSGNGWTAGADASVALAQTGANSSISTETANAPVIAFVLTTSGLMFNASINGTKVSKLDI